MKINVPNACPKQKALFIVDVQPKTIEPGAAMDVQNAIVSYIAKSNYDLYVVVSLDATENSMLYKQKMFAEFALDSVGPSDPHIIEALQQHEKNYIEITKETRSGLRSFEPDQPKKALDEHNIAEIHVTGFDINDCVLATAYDALDSGYYTYVIEELSHHAEGDEQSKNAALTVLREQKMTNHSVSKKISETLELVTL